MKQKVGEYILDMVVDEKIVLELKAASEHNPLFEAQLYSYLQAAGLKLGILLNFGTKRLTYKRILS
jgi:GxxExxY protein